MLELDVFIEGFEEPIGLLRRHSEGNMSFEYAIDDPRCRISISMPVRDKRYGDSITRGFFSNLLFENTQRDQAMQKHGLDFEDIVGLLFHLGRDCPGAISVVPKGSGPAKAPGNLETDYDELDDDQLHEIMVSLRDHRRLPDGTKDPSPLAGVQGKIAVTMLENGRLALPKSGLNVPSTHILKVPRINEMRMVQHEHVLMQIAAGILDHPVAETNIIEQGEVQGLLITRYDRRIEGSRVRRIHQEDFCQALGLGPSLKYQRGAEGVRVFNAKAVGELLKSCSNPGKARQAFIEGTILNLLLGNIDNHAKNHSLLYTGNQSDDRPELAPFYDIVPTIIDSSVVHQLSFDIGAAQMTDEITSEDIAAFAADLGYRRVTPALSKRLQKITQAVIDEKPHMSGPALKRIGDVIAEQSRWIAPAVGLQTELPSGDLIVIRRP